ncbi:MAG: DoxX family membrane protein [Bacteroidetes bacterium]|nr:DoxX family membrane protein [Bacteroidota bacterium]
MNSKNLTANKAGLYTIALRMVIGWTYFSAFWRRLVLENKLDPEQAGYIGEKFNHFLPNALGIKPIIEYLVSNPDALYINMYMFTIVEAIVGLFIIFGLFTRLMSIGVFALASGILLGSGWIGTTCLDEWQIGVLGIAGGFTLFMTGSSSFSLDALLINKESAISKKKWFKYLGSGEWDLQFVNSKKFIIPFALFILGVTLFTNQVFHGGVWGKLHNKSVKPIVEISNINLSDSELNFEVYRVEGADVYGSFLIGIEVLDEESNVLKTISMKELSNFPLDKIKNHYVAKVKPGKHSMIIPLGAKADLSIDIDDIDKNEIKAVKLIDISGAEWLGEI